MARHSFEGRESQAGPESENPRPSIRLEFFRHDDKEKSPPPGGSEPDTRLTAKGRVHASEAGKAKQPKLEAAVAVGSPRVRSGETALRHMTSGHEAITPEMSLEDMQAVIDKELQAAGHRLGQRKDRVDQRLNFNYDGTPAMKAAFDEHYGKTKDAVPWLYQESDRLMVESGDETSTSYSRAAGNIAELIDRYAKILPRWTEIVGRDPEKYDSFGHELQRFLGSHGTYVEMFLLKVMEKIDGPDAARKFIAGLPSSNGFDFSQGYSVTLDAPDGTPQATVRYQDKTWTVGMDVLADIISDRDELNQKVETAMNGKAA